MGGWLVGWLEGNKKKKGRKSTYNAAGFVLLPDFGTKERTARVISCETSSAQAAVTSLKKKSNKPKKKEREKKKTSGNWLFWLFSFENGGTRGELCLSQISLCAIV